MYMNRKRKKYKRILFDDRKLIERLCEEGKTTDEIASIIGVNQTTMYRELARGGVPYSARTAQDSLARYPYLKYWEEGVEKDGKGKR